MKNILFLSLLTLSATVSWADNKNNTSSQTKISPEAIQDVNTISIKTRPEIVGLWGMRIPNNKRCIEYYNFQNENQLVVKSDQEWSTGLYEYRPSTNPDQTASELIIQIQYDNNEKDCSGNQVDQTGEMSQYFVQWKSPTTIEFCDSAKAEKCFAELKRILP
jgi:hypothetical protein